MSEVFLAVRRGPVGFAKLLVIKRLRDDLGGRADGAGYRALLLDEATLSARLEHPNIVQTFEVGEHDGAPFLAMEYLDGQSLDRVFAAAQRAGIEVSVELCLRVIADVLAALDYAHNLADYDGTPLGIVHRDVSPQNVFWTYQGEIKLVDFGVAKYAFSSTETEVGLVKGKLTYMAPEQALRTSLDRRADVFPAGIVMWECLARQPLLPGNSAAAALKQLLYDPLPSLSIVRPDLDPAIVAICDRALERDLDRRYPSAGAMRADIERVLGPSAPQRAELSNFVQRLFAAERRSIAHQIHAAMSSDDVVELSSRDPLPSTVVEIVESTDYNRRPAASQTQAPSRWGIAPGRAGRGWRVALVAAAGILAAAMGLAAVKVRSTHPPRPEAIRAAAAAEAVASQPALAPTPVSLRMCGSNTIGAELGPALAQAFLDHKGATGSKRSVGAVADQRIVSATLEGKPLRIEINARGSATAFEGLSLGQCDIGMSSRPIDSKETATLANLGHGDLRSPASEHVIALDGIAVVVHPNNPLRTLDRQALHDVFTGRVHDWAELGGSVGPITVLARDSKSGTFDTFKHLVLGKDELAKGARRFVQSDELSDAVAGDPSAIGFIGLAYVRSAKAIAVHEAGAVPMLPTSFTVATEGYLLARRLYFYTLSRPRSPLVTEMVSFALSARGQAVVAQSQFVDLTPALLPVLRNEPCDHGCPPRYRSTVAGAQRISVDFRFRTGSNEADSRAVRDLDRLVTLLHDHQDAELLLLGFSDALGGDRVNAKLSLERAHAIEIELASRGVRAAVIRGFGAAMPVGSNATDSGRERNRRVEVWLRK